MPFENRISRYTHFSDLDWNRHVTSRAYERFCYDGRFSLLESLGYPIHSCLEKGIKFVSLDTNVRFQSQQFQNAKLEIHTIGSQGTDRTIYFDQVIYDQNEKKVCSITASAYLIDAEGNRLLLEGIPTQESSPFTRIGKRLPEQNTLKHKMHIPFSDMSCFWNLPSESVWKIFEEGRFLFFKEIIDLNFIHETDSTTFFMGGDIQIHTLPEPGSEILLLSWIECIEKIRFYFRQDILTESGETIASMRDEQLFVQLSTSRPRKAPKEFVELVEPFLEKR
ncbi:acyl-CoA thioesterase [Leptospira ryugenii]|nr:acyl-[acyl-carrier-protein] thioesterase [Leptospira ryugenii]